MHYVKSLQVLSHTFTNLTFSDYTESRFTVPVPSFHENNSDSLSTSDNSNLNVKFLYSNVRSLVSKIHDLNNYLSIYKPEVIALTETWLDDRIPTSFFCPQNYVAYRKDRQNKKGGGCVVLISKTLLSKPVSILKPKIDDGVKIDAVACRLPLACGTSMGVLCIYRPPGLSDSENSPLYDILNNFLDNNFKFNIIIGDFNFPDIQWPGSSSSFHSDTFLNFVHENFLLQHVMSSTRKASQSILDLVLSTQGTNIHGLTVNEEFGTSDHSIINFSVPLRPTLVKRKVKRRNLEKADWSLFRQSLAFSSPDIHQALLSEDIDEVWACFLSILNAALDTVAPVHEISTRNFVSCSKVRTALRHKRRRFKALSENNIPSNVIAYARAVEIVKRTTYEDVIKRENRLLYNANPRYFWSYVNRRMSSQTSIKSLKSNTSEAQDPDDLSNIFNDYFVSVFTPASDFTIQDDNRNPPLLALSQIAITTEDVCRILGSLSSKSSVDNDNLSYKILKEGGVILAEFLAYLFSLSLRICRIPSAWKVAIVSPIHKGGPKNVVSNYRPISVTSCCCRVLERIVRNKINDFLFNRHFITDSQHGFVSGRSTDTMLLKFYDYVTDKVDNGMVVDSVFFDFSKAFDVIPHNILISRLESSGILGNVLLWIKDFLSNRQQMVRIGHVSSNLLPVTSGVIQGSVLGPTLFNIFINDIDTHVKYCTVLKYADDLRIFLSSTKSDIELGDLQRKVQQDINSITKWACVSGMKFNINKCFYTTFGRSLYGRTYFINENIIPYSLHFRDLGVMVSSPLSFNNHIDSIVSKAFVRLGLIYKVFENKSAKSIPHLFKAFVRPILEYSSIIWNPYTVCNINKIERVQRRMCRMIPVIRHLPYRDQLKSLHLYSLKTRRLRYQLTMIFSFINK